MRTIGFSLALLLATTAVGQVPAKIGYQGRLLKSDGSVETGTVSLTFNVWDSASGGTTPLYTETQQLALSDGYYATYLGATKILDLAAFSGGDRYLELVVGTTPLSPRQLIGSVPYALTCINQSGGTVNASSVTIAAGGALTVGSTTVVNASGLVPATVISGTLPATQVAHGPSSGLDADTVDGEHAAALHDFTKLTGVPAAFSAPVAAGASAQIVSAITVNAKSDCGGVAPLPHLQVFVNGDLVGETDVTVSSYADTAVFTLNPARFANEVAVAFANDNATGGCDHNLYVDHVTLTTPGGPVVLRATDSAHAIIDRTNYFDGIDVMPASSSLLWTGALRFFLGQTWFSPTNDFAQLEGATQTFAANAWTAVNFNAAPRAKGVGVTGGTTVTFARPGTYQITLNFRIDQTCGDIWTAARLVEGSTDVGHSAGAGTVPPNPATFVFLATVSDVTQPHQIQLGRLAGACTPVNPASINGTSVPALQATIQQVN
jgi:hypothetical protein